MTFGRDLSFDEWEEVGAMLFRFEEAWQWWVGDWINYGEKKYGETYKAAIGVTGKSISTLKSVASVCNEFEMCRRQHISFTHHQLCQSMEPGEQDSVLSEAVAEQKPASWIREQVHGKKELPSSFEKFEKLWESSDLVGQTAIRAFVLGEASS